MDSGAYIKYVTDPVNGLFQEKEINSYQFAIQYKPLDWMLLQDVKNNSFDNDEARTKYESSCYFIIKIKGIGKTTEQGFSPTEATGLITTADSYLNFQMQQDVFLVAGTDTLQCGIMHREPYNSLTDMNTFIMAFKKPKCSQCDYSIIYNGNYFDSKLLKFNFRKEDLNHVPKLKI